MLKNKILLFILPVLFAFSAYTQNGPSTWFELEFSKKIVKNLKVEFNPELRLLGGFKMDSYILEGGLSYKLHKYLTFAGYYRYENEWKYKNSTGAYKGQVSSNRIAFDAKSGFEMNRFDFQFRIRYTNGADFDQTTNDKASYFRYRAKIDYDIKGSKLVPFVSIEAFHDLILKDFDKMRYTGGLAYAINKNNEIGLFYRLQDYLEPKDYTGDPKESMNIIGIGYSLKF
jgi:long-subunit fatty acid transport protein